MAFPLPGERSQVDAALHLFKISQIIGDALENLYTTTRRRGGVAKIVRLQAELDMWTRSLPGTVTNTESWTSSGAGGGAAFEAAAEAESQLPQPEAAFEAMFLKVLLWSQLFRSTGRH